MKKKGFEKLKYLLKSITIVMAGLLAFNVTHLMAATNTAIDEGSGGISLSSSGAVTVTSTQLGLVKAVFDTSGNCLASQPADAACNSSATSTAVLTGTEVVFVIYVDNTTSINANNVRFQDAIDDITAGPDYFEFQTDTFAAGKGIMIATGIGTGSSKAAIWTALSSGTSLTNALDGSTGTNEYCGIDTTVSPDLLTCGGDASSPNNDQVDITNSTITAIKFHVIKRD